MGHRDCHHARIVEGSSETRSTARGFPVAANGSALHCICLRLAVWPSSVKPPVQAASLLPGGGVLISVLCTSSDLNMHSTICEELVARSARHAS